MLFAIHAASAAKPQGRFNRITAYSRPSRRHNAKHLPHLKAHLHPDAAARFNPVPQLVPVRRYGDKTVHCAAGHDRVLADNDAS